MTAWNENFLSAYLDESRGGADGIVDDNPATESQKTEERQAELLKEEDGKLSIPAEQNRQV